MMLPNLSRITLKSPPTGVAICPDVSRTFTAEEYSTLMGVINPAPVPASAPAPPAQQSNTATQPSDALPGTMSALLNADDLASILGAIGGRGGCKKLACQDAVNFCSLNKEHLAAGDGAIPDVWRDMAKRIFDVIPNPHDNPDDKDVYGLIYHAYRDDAHPREAFNNMRSALELVDVLASRFTIFAIDEYRYMLERNEENMGTNWRKWSDKRYLDDWKKMATTLFDSAPLKNKCLEIYNNDEIFETLVNEIFSVIASYLFGDHAFEGLAQKAVGEEPWSDEEEEEKEHSDEDEEEEAARAAAARAAARAAAVREAEARATARVAIFAIGKVLGVYIVGLWKLERNLSAWGDDHDKDVGLIAIAERNVLADQKREEITAIRVRISSCVNFVLWGPDFRGKIATSRYYANYNLLKKRLQGKMKIVSWFDIMEDVVNDD
tara:strand:+ start:1198 stop:2505 length:1308 start_codon:yes stop_codon:yes gene_type:complete